MALTTEELATRAAGALREENQTIVPELMAEPLADLLDSLVRARTTHGAPPPGYDHVKDLVDGILTVELALSGRGAA